MQLQEMHRIKQFDHHDRPCKIQTKGVAMPYLLDCKGEPCPNPVLRCKRVLEQENPQILHVEVDNEAARVNVSRYLASQGMEIGETTSKDNVWTVRATRLSTTQDAHPMQTQDRRENPTSDSTLPPKILVFLSTDKVGRGDDVLGERLMGNFINTLPELGDSLWRIVMLNSAVRLATSQNPNSIALKKLEEAGVSILVCGTCLEFFGLLEDKVVGQVTNMLDVVTSQQVADKIITL